MQAMAICLSSIVSSNQAEQSFSTESFLEFSNLLNVFLDLKYLFKTFIHSNICSILQAMLDIINVETLGAWQLILRSDLKLWQQCAKMRRIDSRFLINGCSIRDSQLRTRVGLGERAVFICDNYSKGEKLLIEFRHNFVLSTQRRQQFF